MGWFTYQRQEVVSGPQTGLNQAYWLYHRSLGRGKKRNPYLLANEWICSNIGWYLRLPIPPFALMRKSENSERFFASLDYGKKTQASDMIPSRVAARLPKLAAGVVLFDILIANPDRHEGNLKVNDRHNPTAIEVFDHDVALFGDKRGKGTARLQKVSDRLGYSMSLKETDYHKIAKRTHND